MKSQISSRCVMLWLERGKLRTFYMGEYVIVSWRTISGGTRIRFATYVNNKWWIEVCLSISRRSYRAVIFQSRPLSFLFSFIYHFFFCLSFEWKKNRKFSFSLCPFDGERGDNLPAYCPAIFVIYFSCLPPSPPPKRVRRAQFRRTNVYEREVGQNRSRYDYSILSNGINARFDISSYAVDTYASTGNRFPRDNATV